MRNFEQDRVAKLKTSIRKKKLQRGKVTSPFNGYYTRDLVSPAGKVEDIPIARFRTGNDGHELRSMGLFAQEKERFYEVVANMHAVGVSQRKVDAFCLRLFGKKAPPATVKRVFTGFLEQEAFQMNKRSLVGTLKCSSLRVTTVRCGFRTWSTCSRMRKREAVLWCMICARS